jgi:type IV secretion system protein VirB2
MKLTFTQERMTSLVLAFLVAYAVLLQPTAAFADPTGLNTVLCAAIGWMTGGIGSAIATLAIIVIGIGALMGKVSWGMAIIVGLGIGIIFGAEDLVGLLNGGVGLNCP